MPDEPIVDSIHRLTAEAVDGRRPAFAELADALFAVASDAELADSALDVLAAAGPKIWIDLDVVLRPGRYGYRDPRITQPTAVHELSNPLAVALAACGRNGRERHRAIGHPAMRTDVRLFPVLAIRTADWAETVQDRALRVLGDVLTDADAAALLAVVPVVARIGDRSRGNRTVETVRDALRRADDSTLSIVRGCADLHGRRFVFDVSLEAGRMDPRQLAAASLHESDIISRTRCAEALAARAIDRDQPELMEELLAGRSARVRVTALTTLVRLGHPRHGARFLDDDASMVRLTAQWAVRRAGGDPAELYRQRLQDAADRGRRRGLLAGLGDCATSAEAALVLPYLRDHSSRVRTEAVRTLRRLDALADVLDAQGDVVALLEDPAPVVVRNVADLLRASGSKAPAERLWGLLGDADRPRHVRETARRLLADRDAWTRIKADLLLSGDPDALLSSRASADLAALCGRDAAYIHQRCPAELRGELEELLVAAEDAVGPETTRLLRWLVRSGR
ncbi:hypothetical protein [Nonomuraea guangzhouensis]|uniref:HEAT repeat domain-containing protein n=2 Tax=Nonomuraea guangzhouensis TaxID=1291555 RepID=A0ABW4G4A1_9ACTN|nr:hypothetical protein [Nonomuraea guangzhouensis]